ncbi:MAG: SDR family NAD(P)-dependent oxidoreductase [Candidatus Sulfotelmatobacter sp.]
MSEIVIVGMACCYPDARNPQELWENVLARRRAFRRFPPERLLLRDYFSADPETVDAIYATQAALIEGYEFDRVRFRVAGPTFRSVDMAHWLALDVAAQALDDAGLAGNGSNGRDSRLPCETTGVLVGNTLTGEFSRAATLRLRWPYVRRVVEAQLSAQGWGDLRRRSFLRDLEQSYKEPFAPVGEETLAGALSNTIAGRICNHFHLGGGGYTVDGACCSSLLAVARACSALDAGEIDAALTGGVDLSLDPFELVGFAKTGALAHGEMRVYDRESSGFLPGEGCGFVVLMRSEDAQCRGLRSYGVIRGWGIASDGAGSITRPEIRGQTLALQRAYQRAGYGAETVAFFEGHGTGTPIGDKVELQALTAVRRLNGETLLAAIGSIKANIGHTKAAAGVAGLIKATLAIHYQVLPPATGVSQPRPELEGDSAVLRVLDEAEPWPQTLPVRAGVNSFGFGGINVHVTIEGDQNRRAAALSSHHQFLSSSAQDTELFLFAADSRSALVAELKALAEKASGFSYAELTDASSELARQLRSRSPWRAALVAGAPVELTARLDALWKLADRSAAATTTRHLDPDRGVFLGAGSDPPRIGLLFPGQASPVRLHGGAHARRFASVSELYAPLNSLGEQDPHSTFVAQAAIATAEMAGLRLLDELGIEASVAVGHSIGELSAYRWAGAMSEQELLSLARARGKCMDGIPGPPGVMASISASAAEVQAMLDRDQDQRTVIACFNAPRQIVVAGERGAVSRLVERAHAQGWNATLLATANAFHSPLMAAAAGTFQEALSAVRLGPLRRRVVSTITGTEIPETADLRQLLVQQLQKPVRFEQALAQSKAGVDLFIEVGPGRVLTHLLGAESPAISLDVASSSLVGVLHAAAAAHVLGSPLRLEALFNHRFARPFDLERKPQFFVNPCQLAPAIAGDPQNESIDNGDSRILPKEHLPSTAVTESAAEVVRTLVARRTELPSTAIPEGAHLLRDLHLNSIVVGEIVAAAARQLGIAPPRQLLEFADATVGQTVQALEKLRATASGASPVPETNFAGVDEWSRAFFLDWSARPLRKRASASQPPGLWRVFAPSQLGLAEKLASASLPGSGIIVGLQPERFKTLEQQAGTLLEAAHAALANKGQKRYLVVIGAAFVAAAFARTLHLEDPDVLIRIVDAPLDSRVIDYIRNEVNSPGECVEARYDERGERTQPGWRLLADDKQDEDRIPLGPGDVLLVSGGGKGIVAECALMLARETGAALLIVGRSRPESDAGLAANLEKFRAQAVKAKYICADVTHAQTLRTAICEAEKAFGRVTAIVHGAASNQPRLLRDLDHAMLLRTLAPKACGLRNLLTAVDQHHLRLLLTFGSVIGRAGLRGEADYALANAYQSLLTEQFAHEHPACRCLAFESTAWSAVGMAERLGRVESLHREGIATIPPEQGVSWLRRLLARRLPAVPIVLTGRLGANPPIPMQGPALPLLRFLERPRVYYPGVELVADADLTTASDPYLLDHVFQGQPLLPGVIALEAMAQAAQAVTGEGRMPVFSGVRFERPVIVEAGTHVTLRVAALVRESGQVEVVVRSSQTSFQTDHFRCLCRFTQDEPASQDVALCPDPSRLAVDPEKDLYGRLLFQSGRFRRLKGYRSLNARSCWAEVASGARLTWFSQYLPGALVLGDPAVRDAALHSVQACVPHAVLLPVGVKRLLLLGPFNTGEETLVHAQRRWREGANYCYDVELRTADGVLRERWEELQLRKVADSADRVWPDPLVAAFLEWRVEEAIPATAVAAAFERGHAVDRRSRSERAIQKALGSPQHLVRWRADGKPEVQAEMAVSAAHANGLTLAVAGPQTVACDLEAVCSRPEQVWRDLLGSERWRLAELIAREAGEDFQTAATRVWTALESLKKAAAPPDIPLVLLSWSQEKPSCVSLAASGFMIATSIVCFRDDTTPFAVSILARSEECVPRSDECVTTNTGTVSVLRRPTL